MSNAYERKLRRHTSMRDGLIMKVRYALENLIHDVFSLSFANEIVRNIREQISTGTKL